MNERLLLQLEIDQLNAAYAAALDERRFDDWPGFFLEDGTYTVQARENFDRGLPLALIALESRGMMKDRVYGITQTIYHGPYYTRHVVSPAQVLAQEGSRIRAQAHYAVFRTRPGEADLYETPLAGGRPRLLGRLDHVAEGPGLTVDPTTGAVVYPRIVSDDSDIGLMTLKKKR